MKQQTTFSGNYVYMMVGRMFPLLSLLGVTVLFAHGLPAASYGRFQSVWMYANLVSVLMGFGISTIIFSTPAGVLVTLFGRNRKIILTFYSLLWLMALALFASVTKFSLPLKLLIITFILFQNINSVTETWVLKRGGEQRYAAINLLYAMLFFGWHYYLLTSAYTLEKLIGGVILISVVKLMLLLVGLRAPASMKPAFVEDRKIFGHWAYIGINDVVNIFSKWIDKLILVYLLTPAEFAVFFNGSIEIPLLIVVISITSAYSMMQMAKEPANNARVQNIFSENFRLLSAVAFPLFFYLLFFREDIFLVFFGEKYLASVPVFAITILVLPFRINEYSAVLKVRSRGDLVTRGSVMELMLAILLIFILYPLYGTKGAASALVLSTIFQISFYLYHTQKVTGIKVAELIPLKVLFVRFLACGMLFFGLSALIKSPAPMAAVLMGLCLFLLAALLMAWPQLAAMMRKRAD